jgi:hypothetical protein
MHMRDTKYIDAQMCNIPECSVVLVFVSGSMFVKLGVGIAWSSVVSGSIGRGHGRCGQATASGSTCRRRIWSGYNVWINMA